MAPRCEGRLAHPDPPGNRLWGSTEHEVVLAEMICKAFPSIENVRLVNSGTEATMSAIRLARAFTGRSRIIKFDGAITATRTACS